MNQSVSLIVPVYNAMPYLKECISGIEDQTWRPLECIFADDGSTDGSLEYLNEITDELRKYGLDVKILALPHGGQAAAVNAALKEVTGEFLTWCDADDLMAPKCIELKVRYLNEHPDTGLVRNDGYVLNGDEGGMISRSTKEKDRKDQDIFEELLRQTTYCYAGCYMVRMPLFDECYPEREIPISSEGQNLQLLLPPASRSICGYIPEILHFYYQRSSGHSSMKRSYTKTRERKMNFIKLYREILPYCACNQEYYTKVIDELEKQYLEDLKLLLIQQVKKEIKERESGNSNIS